MGKVRDEMLTLLGAEMLKRGMAFKLYNGKVHFLVGDNGGGLSALCGAGKNSTGKRHPSVWIETTDKANCVRCLKIQEEHNV